MSGDLETLIGIIRDAGRACNWRKPDREDTRVRLVAPFMPMLEETEEMVGGTCVMFSMTENIAKALCSMENELPAGIDSVDVHMPSSLSFGVRGMEREAEQSLMALGKGDIDDIVLGDAGSLPDDVSVRVSGQAVSVFVKERVNGISYVAEARFPGDMLLAAVRDGLDMSDEAAKNAMAALFEEDFSASGDSPSPR